MREQRQRAVNLHPFNQGAPGTDQIQFHPSFSFVSMNRNVEDPWCRDRAGGRVAGSVHVATDKGLVRANLAALRVCRKDMQECDPTR